MHDSARQSAANVTAGFEDYNNQMQPVDLGGATSELANWRCAEGTYQDGVIKCKVPKLPPGSYDPDGNLQYNVDIALNGQQFTGRPLVFRYYDIRLDKI